MSNWSVHEARLAQVQAVSAGSVVYSGQLSAPILLLELKRKEKKMKEAADR